MEKVLGNVSEENSVPISKIIDNDNPSVNEESSDSEAGNEEVTATAKALESVTKGIVDADRKRAENDGVIYHRRDFKKIIFNAVMYSFLAVSFFLIGLYFYRFHTTMRTMQLNRFVPNPWLVVWWIAGILLMLVSSAQPYWNYHHRRRMFLISLIGILGAVLMPFYFALPYKIIIPLLLKIEPNQWTTKEKWLFLFRILTVVPTVVLTALSIQAFSQVIFDRFALQQINSFRIGRYFDFRKHKKQAYDAKVVTYMSNGRSYNIREKDRYLHGLITGPTGTAKTTSIIVPMVNADLNKRCDNEDAAIKKIMEMFEEGKAYMCSPVKTKTSYMDSIVPVEGHEHELDEITGRYRRCGITVIAPDSSLTDQIYQLCVAKGISCNVIDPIEKDIVTGEMKPGFIGFNPLYISPTIPERARRGEIVKRASLFASVLAAIDELKGKGDPYFTNLNRNITISFAICLMVTVPLVDHRQSNPNDLKSCINKFDRIKPYYEKLKQIDKKKEYEFVTDFIETDIFGSGKDKMLDQVRGLRNLLDLLLANPYIEKALCPDDKTGTVDIDKILSEGQITVVNYALELGKEDSMGFGLFFLLSFIDAVLRRPGTEKSRIPHFLYVDELPVILHPRIEEALSLFRKYRCSFIGCIQGLDQMAKSEVTKFLRGILLSGCSHHFVFGRMGVTEMEEYSKLAGKEWIVSEQISQSETALSTENPTLTYQTRETLQKDNVLEGSDMRNLPFQEITMFSVRESSLIPPFHGRVDFLDEKEWNKRKRLNVDWDKLYSKYGAIRPDDETMGKIEENMPLTQVTENNPVTGSVILSDSLTDVPEEDDEEDMIVLE